MVDPLDEAGIWLPARLWEQMRADVQARLPQEACGLVGGLQRRALQVYPVANALHSPVRYRMEPDGQVRVFLELERHGWDLLAIYHAHPAGPDQPFPTDLAEAAYPEAVHLIWSPQAGGGIGGRRPTERRRPTDHRFACRGFLIRAGQFSEIPVWVVEE